MNLLIVGGYLANLGSELMLRSLVAELRRRHPDHRLCISPYTRRLDRADDLDLTPLNFPLPHVGDRYRFLPAFRFRRLLRRRGRSRIGWSEVGMIFDIAGFAYSDQWGSAAVRHLDVLTRNAAANGAKSVLMPQAFGPFRDPRAARAMRSAVGRAALVFARDRESLAYLNEVAGPRENVSLAPDITLAFESAERAEGDYLCTVPNVRMLDQGREAWGHGYLDLLSDLIGRAHRSAGWRTLVVVHESGKEDLVLAREVAQRSAAVPVELVIEEDPRKLKALLAGARCVVGSRFHALASALSCSVPSIALGWSHKYRELFADYGIGELAFDRPGSEIVQRFFRLADDGNRAEIRGRLRAANRRLRIDGEAMWLAIDSLVTRVASARCHPPGPDADS